MCIAACPGNALCLTSTIKVHACAHTVVVLPTPASHILDLYHQAYRHHFPKWLSLNTNTHIHLHKHERMQLVSDTFKDMLLCTNQPTLGVWPSLLSPPLTPSSHQWSLGHSVSIREL